MVNNEILLLAGVEKGRMTMVIHAHMGYHKFSIFASFLSRLKRLDGKKLDHLTITLLVGLTKRIQGAKMKDHLEGGSNGRSMAMFETLEQTQVRCG